MLQLRRKLYENLYAKNESKEEDEGVNKRIYQIIYERKVIC